MKVTWTEQAWERLLEIERFVARSRRIALIRFDRVSGQYGHNRPAGMDAQCETAVYQATSDIRCGGSPRGADRWELRPAGHDPGNRRGPFRP